MKRAPMLRALRDALRIDRRLLPGNAPLGGRIIRRLTRRVEVFCRIDAYERYDAEHIAADDRITGRDVEGANAIGAGITPAWWEAITALGRLDELAAIAPDADLLACEDAIWTREIKPKVAALFDRLADTPHVETPRATKVLYLKRPGLIPPCDATLLAALSGNASTELPAGLRAMELMRRIGRAHAAPLERAERRLHERGLAALTPLRILESALSMEASGKYDALWDSLGWSSWTEPEPPELRLFDAD